MKFDQMKNKLLVGFILTFFLALTQCGGNGSSSSSDDTTDTEANTSNVATRGLSDSLTTSLDSITGVGSSALVKGLNKSESEGEHAEEANMEDYDCSYNPTDKSVTCNCPGGGSVTHNYADGGDFEDVDGEFSFNHTFSATFEECVMISCEESQTLDGTINGTVSGGYNPETGFSLTMTYGTEQECSGMSVNDNVMGFQMTTLLENEVETISGSFCLESSGEVITFDSLDDLDELFGTSDGCYQTQDDSEDAEDTEDEESEEESEEHHSEEHDSEEEWDDNWEEENME